MSSTRDFTQVVLSLIFILVTIVIDSDVQSYELKLDKEQDRILWKFKGHYLYTQSSEDLEDLLNTGSFPARHRTTTSVPHTGTSNLQLPQNGLFDSTANKRSGIWFTKNLPNRQNTLVLTYTLKHALFTQGWVSFYATPKVEVKVRTNQDELIARFWNDGQDWCDAVVSMGLKTTFTLEVSTPEPNDYFLLDKIIMGIFSNVSQLNGRKLNPCLTSPNNATTQSPMHLQTPSRAIGEVIDVNSLEETSTTSSPRFAALVQPLPLSRTDQDFIRSTNSYHRNEPGSEEIDSSTFPHTVETTTMSKSMSPEDHQHVENVLQSSFNRQSRSSESEFSQVKTFPDSEESKDIVDDDAKSKSTSTVDLQVSIPVTSSILQHIKDQNKLANQSQNSLQCSCSCSGSSSS